MWPDRSKSGVRRSLDQGSELGHLILGLRICACHCGRSGWTATRIGVRRLGFESLRARSTIKAVTSGNAGHGLDCFPGCAVIFHMMGAWCSEGAPMSACCFVGGPYRPTLTSASTCRLVWIMAGPSAWPISEVCPLWSHMWISPGRVRRPDSRPPRAGRGADLIQQRPSRTMTRVVGLPRVRYPDQRSQHPMSAPPVGCWTATPDRFLA